MSTDSVTWVLTFGKDTLIYTDGAGSHVTGWGVVLVLLLIAFIAWALD